MSKGLERGANVLRDDWVNFGNNEIVWQVSIPRRATGTLNDLNDLLRIVI